MQVEIFNSENRNLNLKRTRRHNKTLINEIFNLISSALICISGHLNRKKFSRGKSRGTWKIISSHAKLH